MQQMFKTILLFILIIQMMSFSVFAEYDYRKYYKVNAFNSLKEYRVIEECENWSETDIMTRGGLLRMLLRIQNARYTEQEQELIWETNKDNIDEKIIDKYTDIDINNEKEAVLVSEGERYNLFNGKINENGNRIADFDSCITWQEALIMINRMFLIYGDELGIDEVSKENTYLSFAKNIRGYYLKDDDWWLKVSEELELINCDDHIVDVKYSDKDKKVNVYDIAYVVYRSLYIPITRRNYSGDYTYYYINDIYVRDKSYSAILE